ncbi:MAG: GNAT family N-acetyltransferase [Litorilinea sp.]
MMPVETFFNCELPPEFYTLAPGYPLPPDSPTLRQADAHLLARDATGAPVARASLWWRNTAMVDNSPSGYIGHYAVRVATSPTQAHTQTHIPAQADADVAHTLLNRACALLRQHGCAQAIGPLDGSTFRQYRFVTQRRGLAPEEPPFLLEPQNPDAWPQHFIDAGFAPIARYISALGTLAPTDPSLAKLRTRAQAAGAILRPVNLAHFSDELEHIYAVVTASFRDNFLYRPLDFAEFREQYLPLQKYIQPELAWLAEKAGQVVGFIFAVPNLAQAQRGETVDTVIIKTVAVLPQSGVLGLGNLLTAQCQQAAYRLGYRRVIHALMHVDNISTRISRRYAQTMRGYTLFAKTLAR